MNKKTIAILLGTTCLLVGGAYYIQSSPTNETKIENSFTINSEKEEIKSFVQNFLTSLAEGEESAIISTINYNKFLSTETSNSKVIVENRILKLKDKIKKNKESIDKIEITSYYKDENNMYIDYFWNNERGSLFFVKENDKWALNPFGIKEVTPIKEVIVTQGYLPLKITGTIATKVNDSQRMFLFFGTMETVLASWETHYPINIVFITDTNERIETNINKIDLERVYNSGYISEKPMYLEFDLPKFSGKIKSISFNNLFVKNNMENYKERDFNNSVKMNIAY